MLEGTKSRLEAIGWKEPLKGRKVSADTGYYSVKNLEVCRDLGVDAYVPDPQFRKRDIRFADAGRHRRSVDKRHERYKSNWQALSIVNKPFCGPRKQLEKVVFRQPRSCSICKSCEALYSETA